MTLRRWPRRSKALAVLAVAAGAGSFTLARGYADELEAARSSPGELVEVVVADRSLARGSEVAPEGVRVERVPSAYAAPGAFDQVRDVVGRTLTSDVAEGETLTATRVGSAGGPVASVVAGGLRAFVVASGLPSGVLEPGDRVDVIATFGGPHPYTDTVGTGLEVLSIVGEDAAFEAGGPAGPSLVLLVGPETAEQLAHATAFGQITVTIAPLDPV